MCLIVQVYDMLLPSSIKLSGASTKMVVPCSSDKRNSAAAAVTALFNHLLLLLHLLTVPSLDLRCTCTTCLPLCLPLGRLTNAAVAVLRWIPPLAILHCIFVVATKRREPLSSYCHYPRNAIALFIFFHASTLVILLLYFTTNEDGSTTINVEST